MVFIYKIATCFLYIITLKFFVLLKLLNNNYLKAK